MPRSFRFFSLAAAVGLAVLSAQPAARATAGSISGRVTSSTTGQGLAGAVWFYDLEASDFVAQVPLDGSGNYTVNLPDSVYAVLTQNTQGHINEIYDNVQCSAACDLGSIMPVTVSGNAVTGIDFVLDPGGRIAGTVTDAGTGQPIAGLQINFIDTNQTTTFTTAVTNALGQYISDGGSVSGNVLAFTTNTVGYRDEVYDNIYCLDCDLSVGTPIPVTLGATTSNINFALDAGGRITGTVVNNVAAPLSGVRVRIRDNSGNMLTQTVTDASGNYSTTGLPGGTYFANTENDLGLVDRIYNNVLCPGGFCSTSGATPITVTLGATTSGINFTLGPGGTITGTVTAAIGGAAIAGAQVSIYNSSGTFVLGVQTNGAGQYTTPAVPAGTYYAAILNMPGFANQLYNGLPCGAGCVITNGTAITVVASQATGNVNFSLSAGAGISGRVTAVSNGQGIQNVVVQLFSSGGTLVNAVVTQADGTYTLSGLAAGTYYVRTANSLGYVNELYDNILCPEAGCAPTTGTPIVVNTGTTVSNINFALVLGGRISGTVTEDGAGTGIAGITVQIFNSIGTKLGDLPTNSIGGYISSGLPAGTYYVRTFNMLGYGDELYDNIPCVPNCIATNGTQVLVNVGATTSNINFALVNGGSIAGTVFSASPSAPLSGVFVHIYTSAGAFAKSGQTNASGAYTVAGLSPGTYYAVTAVSGTQYYQNELYNELPCSPSCTVTTGTPITVTVGTTQSGVNFTLSGGAGTIEGTVTEAVTGVPLANVAVRVYTSAGTLVRSINSSLSGSYSQAGLPAGVYYLRTFVTNLQPYIDELYNNIPCFPNCAVTSGTPVTVVADATQPGIDFSLSINLIRNGRFNNGTTDWLQFATPDMSYMVSQLTNGVFEYYRVAPPPGTSNQAVVFQETGFGVDANAALVARFSLGNSSTTKKRISVLVIDSDFSDLAVCSFWIEPGTLLTPYQMKTHTTKSWGNASLYFYAASPGSNGGFYQLDDVSLVYAPDESVTQTECVDPTAPEPAGGPAGPEMLVNGNFDTGQLTPWGTFGTITHQIVGGVFEFIRNPGQPAGVVLQPTGQPLSNDDIMTATFQLGNSSSVRKRVTVLLHDGNFSDLSACTFWLPPGLPLSDYTMQTFATQAWTNATLSVYGASASPDQWIRLDNASFKRTPAAAITGTLCGEPTGTSPGPGAVATTAAGQPGGSVGLADRSFNAGRVAGISESINLAGASQARLSLAVRLLSDEVSGEIQISVDGQEWQTLVVVHPSEDWTEIELDLSPWLGRTIRLRFVTDPG